MGRDPSIVIGHLIKFQESSHPASIGGTSTLLITARVIGYNEEKALHRLEEQIPAGYVSTVGKVFHLDLLTTRWCMAKDDLYTFANIMPARAHPMPRQAVTAAATARHPVIEIEDEDEEEIGEAALRAGQGAVAGTSGAGSGATGGPAAPQPPTAHAALQHPRKRPWMKMKMGVCRGDWGRRRGAGGQGATAAGCGRYEGKGGKDLPICLL